MLAMGKNLLLALVTTSLFAQAPLPPAIPWNGKSRELIAKADNKWITVAEKTAFPTRRRLTNRRSRICDNSLSLHPSCA